MLNRSKLRPDEVASLILLAALLFGTLFRFLSPWRAGFPVNDGGLFYSMINDLKANHYVPPQYSSYNHLDIPFAYPPLALYLGAILSDVLRVPSIAIMHWLPALLNTLCIPAFYYLCREILGDKTRSAVATLVFALTPHLTTWLSVGGGLTRSLGTFFMMFTVLYSYRLFARDEPGAVWATIIFGSLTVLSHTESTIFAITIPIFIWLLKSRTVKSALSGGLVALGVLALAGPWYLLVVSRYGFEPLLSALRTGGQTIGSLARLVNIHMVTEEPYLDLLGACGVLGMILLVVRRDYFIPLLMAVIYLVEPRSAHTVGNIPLAMAAGLFITDVLIARLPDGVDPQKPEFRRALNLLILMTVPYLLINSTYQGFLLAENHVPDGVRTSMRRIMETTPESSRFLVLTGEPESLCDSTSEWFPALSQRTSVATLQGREWLGGQNFAEFIAHRSAIQGCIDEGLECLDRELGYFGGQIDYIYVAVKTPTYNCTAVESFGRRTRGLVIALSASSRYRLVDQSADYFLFEHTGQ